MITRLRHYKTAMALIKESEQGMTDGTGVAIIIFSCLLSRIPSEYEKMCLNEYVSWKYSIPNPEHTLMKKHIISKRPTYHEGSLLFEGSDSFAAGTNGDYVEPKSSPLRKLLNLYIKVSGIFVGAFVTAIVGTMASEKRYKQYCTFSDVQVHNNVCKKGHKSRK